jgi:hypothetical protein
MAKVIKPLEETVTDQFVDSLLGKYIHVPTNKHVFPNPMENGKEEEINAWFAGQVAGCEKAILVFDYETKEMLETPVVHYNILLTDGMGYLLSQTEAEVIELTDVEFTELLAEHHAHQAIEEEAPKLITPDNDKVIQLDRKIQLPGKDF